MTELFSAFKKTSSTAWQEKITAELKGLDYNEALVYSTLEGIDIQPFYAKDTIDYINLPSLPRTKAGWDIFTEITDASILNKNEVDGFVVNLEKNNLVEGYKNIVCCENYNQLKKIPNTSDVLYLKLDIYGDLFSSGNWFLDKTKDHAMVSSLSENSNYQKIICVTNSIFQNAGANMVQQLAFALSHANEYIENFGVDVVPKLFFNFAVGSNHFFEIAKLRAFRFLWQSFLESKNISSEAYILTESSYRNKSILDSYNNVIRNTLEVAAAIFGGSDGILIHPHDSYDNFGEKNNFSAELAHKQQQVLKKEAYLDKFLDPIAGNYFVETITDEMINKASILFKEIEKNGGLIEGIINGSIQKMISISDEKEQALFNSQQQVLIGVNKFRNNEEVINTNPFIEIKIATTTLFEPILAKRLAEEIEQSKI